MTLYYSQENIDGIDNGRDIGLTLPGWYFWNETESYAYGPYESKEIAEEDLTKYNDILNGSNSIQTHEGK